MSTELSPVTQVDKHPQRLECDGGWLTYHHSPAQGEGENSPGVMFLGGFKSDMTGTKATFLEEICTEKGLEFTRFDYMGHGQSSGKFEDGTIGLWADNAITMLDEVTTRPQVLVGSSMGGWVMLLAALKRREKVAGLIGIAAAPDFTEELLWQAFDEKAQEEIEKTGMHMVPNCYDDQEPYPITKALIEDGRKHLLLNDEISIHCPVMLLQGMQDEDVPWEVALRLSRKLASQAVELQLFKDGDHRMSSPDKLSAIEQAITRMLARLD